jgi:hypothetical protein
MFSVSKVAKESCNLLGASVASSPIYRVFQKLPKYVSFVPVALFRGSLT